MALENKIGTKTLLREGELLNIDENVAIEKKIGERIGVLRGLNNNEKQEELAAAMGVSREIVQHWESATRKIKATHIVKLAKHFNVTADYLLGIRPYGKGTYNEDVSTVCEATGLSEDAANMLINFDSDHIRALNTIIENGTLGMLLDMLLALEETSVRAAEIVADVVNGDGVQDKKVYALVKDIKVAKYQLIEAMEDMSEVFAPKGASQAMNIVLHSLVGEYDEEAD